MSEEFKFNIGDEAVKTIIDLRIKNLEIKNMPYSYKSMGFMEINLLMILVS